MHERITTYYGNIFDVDADAIVNAANQAMLGGWGIDGQIHEAAGSHLVDYIKMYFPATNGVRCPTGNACYTPGFKTKYRAIIHTVGPRPIMPNAAELLRDCYTNVVDCAAAISCEHIVIPCIATGIYSYPMGEAAEICLDALGEALERHPDVRVTMAIYNDEEQAIWRDLE